MSRHLRRPTTFSRFTGRQHNSLALITRSRLYCASELHCLPGRLGDPGRSFVLRAGAAGVDGAVFLQTLSTLKWAWHLFINAESHKVTLITKVTAASNSYILLGIQHPFLRDQKFVAPNAPIFLPTQTPYHPPS